MNAFDSEIIRLLNGMAQRSWAFDQFVYLLGTNVLLKTGPILVLLYRAWFREDESGKNEDRPRIAFGVIAPCAAVLFARAIALVVPFRERPLRTPELHFLPPHSVSREAILGWSSFPSDNAILFFGVAMGLFLVSRRAGILAFCHVFVVVAFARVYLGYHYPTDIVAGALLGIGSVSLILVPRVTAAFTPAAALWLRTNPRSFQTAFFFLVFLLGTTFEPVYEGARFAVVLARKVRSVLGDDHLAAAALVFATALVVAVAWIIVRRIGSRARTH